MSEPHLGHHTKICDELDQCHLQRAVDKPMSTGNDLLAKLTAGALRRAQKKLPTRHRLKPSAF